jgi:hypothetical protein
VRQFNKDRTDAKVTEQQTNDAADKAKRVDTIAELRAILDVLRTDFDAYKKESKAELKETRAELDASEVRSHECDRKGERMSAHIFYLEEVIRRAGNVDFRPWSEVAAGSGPHASLKEFKS